MSSLCIRQDPEYTWNLQIILKSRKVDRDFDPFVNKESTDLIKAENIIGKNQIGKKKFLWGFSIRRSFEEYLNEQCIVLKKEIYIYIKK